MTDGFERWQELFGSRRGKMRERRPEADPVALTHLLAAAFQGGLLPDQAAIDDSAPSVNAAGRCFAVKGSRCTATSARAIGPRWIPMLEA
ncbi:hypothetical protein [Nonomuraea sp. NPDC005650]|uniref:hypothetical protein n=1 Tax=Nonomuraea sp. NPDC005650 TaxID=3157045 RepID=UPI0033A4852D